MYDQVAYLTGTSAAQHQGETKQNGFGVCVGHGQRMESLSSGVSLEHMWHVGMFLQ